MEQGRRIVVTLFSRVDSLPPQPRATPKPARSDSVYPESVISDTTPIRLINASRGLLHDPHRNLWGLLQENRRHLEEGRKCPMLIHPGGRSDEGETWQQTLQRELEEELELNIPLRNMHHWCQTGYTRNPHQQYQDEKGRLYKMSVQHALVLVTNLSELAHKNATTAEGGSLRIYEADELFGLRAERGGELIHPNLLWVLESQRVGLERLKSEIIPTEACASR